MRARRRARWEVVHPQGDSGRVALTGKQQRFVAEYLVDMNATQAAVRAGYSPRTAHAQGSFLLTNVEIRKAVAAANKKHLDKVEARGQKVLDELAHFAHSDVGEAFDEHGALLPLKKMPERIRRAISSIEVLEQAVPDGKGGEVVTGYLKKVKFWPKDKGLELLGKHQRLFTDRVEHDLGPSLEELLRESLGDGK